jgi:hypothetical protein
VLFKKTKPCIQNCDAFVKLGTVILDSPVVVSDICIVPVLFVVSVEFETVFTGFPVVVPEPVVCPELSDMSAEVVNFSKNNYRY